ncbi:MAG: hypothetical protein ACC682_14645 [Gemmatimonadota bacterium]
MGVFFFIIIIVGLVTGGEIVSKYLDRRAAPPVIGPAGDGEVTQLREQVEYLTSQVERLSEEQRFMTKLLEGSPGGSVGRRTGNADAQ